MDLHSKPQACWQVQHAILINVSSTSCQMAVSRQLLAMQGYLVLLGSLVRSLPQCIRIVKSKSAEGVSLSAVVAELVAFTITIAYNIQRGKLFVHAWPAIHLLLKHFLVACLSPAASEQSWKCLPCMSVNASAASVFLLSAHRYPCRAPLLHLGRDLCLLAAGCPPHSAYLQLPVSLLPSLHIS